ncbi:TPA: Flp pilus assembly protein TadD [Stenotrophomonas maltophilia]
MPALRNTCLLFALVAVAGGCSSTTPKYLRAPSLAAPEPAPQDSRNAYLELIERMQQQGAWYASLAHVDAFRQRYGDPPALRLLQADALRETGQADAAIALYRDLSSGPQAAAAAHGLGLIAARRDDDAGSEQALAQATQLQPLNTSYLGDLGYARLRAGRFEQAREPLAKALELSPGNAKATANLALWAVLRGDTATAERLAQQANLNEETRNSIQQQAAQIRSRLQQRHAAAAAAAAASASAAATVTPPPAPATATATATASSNTTGSTRLAAEPRRDARDARDPQRLPPSMLERFSASDRPNGNTP